VGILRALTVHHSLAIHGTGVCAPLIAANQRHHRVTLLEKKTPFLPPAAVTAAPPNKQKRSQNQKADAPPQSNAPRVGHFVPPRSLVLIAFF